MIEDLKSNVTLEDIEVGQWYWLRILNRNDATSVAINGEDEEYEEIVINEAKLLEFHYNEQPVGNQWCELIFKDHDDSICEVYCELEEEENLDEYIIIRHLA